MERLGGVSKFVNRRVGITALSILGAASLAASSLFAGETRAQGTSNVVQINFNPVRDEYTQCGPIPERGVKEGEMAHVVKWVNNLNETKYDVYNRGLLEICGGIRKPNQPIFVKKSDGFPTGENVHLPLKSAIECPPGAWDFSITEFMTDIDTDNKVGIYRRGPLDPEGRGNTLLVINEGAPIGIFKLSAKVWANLSMGGPIECRRLRVNLEIDGS